MAYFVDKDSIVRKIWSKSDTVLFVFAGAAAEFALNKAVDWLYFTGKLPTDPLARLFSTVEYAKKILFAENDEALKIIDNISSIHNGIEKKRKQSIPAWAYRDVLFMLIHYSIASFETLERKLSQKEKEDVFDVFYRMGKRMQLEDLPESYNEWAVSRKEHLNNDLEKSYYTTDLYKQYKKNLGEIHYYLFIEGQKLVVPEEVRRFLHLNKFSLLQFIIPIYKLSKSFKADNIIKALVLPAKYKKEIKAIEMA